MQFDNSGVKAPVRIMQSNGGVMNLERAKTLPVRTALSGPAAGVIAAAYIGMVAGQPNIISCDMGGTSFDVSLIVNGESSLSAQSSIGFGMVVRTPMVEIVTIGAGGGSIARVDEGWLLQVGPESAGSRPGPACYGLGGTQPTITDANLILGKLDPIYFANGEIILDIDLAEKSILDSFSKQLDISVLQVANAIVEIANNVPRVSNGPKANKIAISPSPLLEANLIGLAV